CQGRPDGRRACAGAQGGRHRHVHPLHLVRTARGPALQRPCPRAARPPRRRRIPPRRTGRTQRARSDRRGGSLRMNSPNLAMSTPSAPSAVSRAWKHPLARPLAALALLLAVAALFVPGFLHLEIKDGHLYGSLVDILHRAAPLMLAALGMTLV